MKLNKLFVVPVVLTALAGGTVLALPDSKPTSHTTSPVKTTKAEQPIKEPPQTVSEPIPATITPTPRLVSEPLVVEKITDEIKAEARTYIETHNKCGDSAQCPVAQAECFLQAIEMRYGWSTVTEQFVMAKAEELNQKYVAMCAALYTLESPQHKANPSSTPGFGN